MTEKFFIPTLCKVGFNEREDTYSGKLGYVIYYDGKKWRKEVSWEGWIQKFMSDEEFNKLKKEEYDSHLEHYISNYNGYKREYGSKKNNSKYIEEILNQTQAEYLEGEGYGSLEDYHYTNHKFSNNPEIKPYEFENKPMEGFVLNKEAGGGTRGWDARATYCRVYDPRGFEVEISIDNLLYILQETNSIKGKGLEGEFVYSWSGKDLVLLPTSSLEYTESLKFTSLSKTKIGVKDLELGFNYNDKYSAIYTYIGKYNHIVLSEYDYGGRDYNYHTTSYVFYDENNEFVFFDNLSKLATKVSDTYVSNIAELVDKFNNSKYFLDETKIEVEKATYYGENEIILVEDADGGFIQYSIYHIKESNYNNYYNRNSNAGKTLRYELSSNKKIYLNNLRIKKTKLVTLNFKSITEMSDLKFIRLKLNDKKMTF